jgi:hypothetical protein
MIFVAPWTPRTSAAATRWINRGRNDLAANELAQWLSSARTPAPRRDDLAAIGLAVAGLTERECSALAQRLRFTLAVLRDVFPADLDVRRWMHTPSTERCGERPLDVLLSGRIDQLERLAVGEWNRLVAAPATTTL